MFELQREALLNRQPHPDFEDLERLMVQVKKSDQTLTVTDLGAGSRWAERQRQVGEIARKGGSTVQQGRRLYRMAHYLQPTTILELGTSLGFGTAYLAKGAPEARVLSLEGDPQLAQLAKQHWNTLQIDHAEVRVGAFESSLPEALQDLQQLDFCFLDGNHRYQATLDYFEACLPYAHSGTVFLLDDIRWSEEMYRAWQTLLRHPRVTVSMDLFFQGLLFLRQKQSEQHFAVRFR